MSAAAEIEPPPDDPAPLAGGRYLVGLADKRGDASYDGVGDITVLENGSLLLVDTEGNAIAGFAPGAWRWYQLAADDAS